MGNENRETAQRKVIRAIFEQAEHPLKPQEVADAARKKLPSLGVATVYRNVNRLVEEGWLETVQIPGDSARYERSLDAHHHFFLCRSCDRVYRVNGCHDQWRALTPQGFELDTHEMILYGRCADCASPGG